MDWQNADMSCLPRFRGCSTLPGSDRPDNWLVYDGDCPFCSAYVRLLRIRENVGPLPLINARDGGPEVEVIAESRLSLDECMVLRLSGRLYHGSDCIHPLVMLSQPAGIANRMNIWIFRSENRSKFLYPILRAGRNLVMRVLRRKKFSFE